MCTVRCGATGAYCCPAGAGAGLGAGFGAGLGAGLGAGFGLALGCLSENRNQNPLSVRYFIPIFISRLGTFVFSSWPIVLIVICLG